MLVVDELIKPAILLKEQIPDIKISIKELERSVETFDSSFRATSNLEELENYYNAKNKLEQEKINLKNTENKLEDQKEKILDFLQDFGGIPFMVTLSNPIVKYEIENHADKLLLTKIS